MSSVFVPQHMRGNKTTVTQDTIQKLLDENSHLIQCIVDNQSTGNVREASQYQQILHRNLVWLATVADSNQSNAQNLLSQTSPKQGASSAMQLQDGKATVAATSEVPSLNGSQPQVASVASTMPSQPPLQVQAVSSNSNVSQVVDPSEPQQPPPSQIFSAPQEHSGPAQAKPQYTQPPLMQGNYPPQYPPSGYSTSMPIRTPQDPAQAHQQQQQPTMQQQPTVPSSLPQYSQQAMMQNNSGMVSSAAGAYPASTNMGHQPPVSYSVATSQGMQQQQYQMPTNQSLMPDQQRQQYSRPPPGQDPGAYPAYSTAPGHQMAAYPPQNQQPQNADYTQYNNTEHQQMPYQQYQQQ